MISLIIALQTFKAVWHMATHSTTCLGNKQAGVTIILYPHCDGLGPGLPAKPTGQA